MNASQVKEIAKEWVDLYASRMPGFCGAHLMGGINYAPGDAPFAAYKDVDMNILLEGQEKFIVHDVSYQGLILEYGSEGTARYQSPEALLGNPTLACNLATNSILADPSGRLAALQAAVAREYPRRQWVTARCQVEKDWILSALGKWGRAGSPGEAILQAMDIVSNLGGLIAVASLKPPTHRRGLILMKELLAAWGRPDLHAAALGIMGFDRLSREQVEGCLQACAPAFDRAVQVIKTPVDFGFKFQPFVRPYLIEGTQEMIVEGCHQEAMYWLGFAFWTANRIIQQDAPEDERAPYQEQVMGMISAMGWNTPQDFAARFQQAQALVETLFTVADEMVSRIPAD